MNARSRIAGIAASALLAISATGCSLLPERVKYVEVSPQCSPPPAPAIDLERGALYEALNAGESESGLAMYNRTEDTIDALIDWGREQRAILREICAAGEATEGTESTGDG